MGAKVSMQLEKGLEGIVDISSTTHPFLDDSLPASVPQQIEIS